MKSITHKMMVFIAGLLITALAITSAYADQRSRRDQAFDELDAAFEPKQQKPRAISTPAANKAPVDTAPTERQPQPRRAVAIEIPDTIVIPDTPVEVLAPVVIVPQAVVIVTPEAKPVKPEASDNTAVTINKNGYRYKADSCQLASGTINCNIYITSLDKNSELTFYASQYYDQYRTKIYDHNGNEYIASSIAIGNKRGANISKKMFISNVISKGRLYFEDIAKETTSISLLVLRGHNHATGKYIEIKFTNVPLGR